MKISINNIFRRTVIGVLISVSVLSVGVIALAIPVAMQQSWSVVLVNNADMAPAIPKGSLVVSEKVSSSSIKVGDVITLNPTVGSSIATVSRVVSTEQADNKHFFYQVQGDNNILPDSWSYRVGASTYKLMATVPVIGFFALPLNNVFGALTFVLLIATLSWILLSRFYKAPVVEEVVPEEPTEGIEDMRNIFAESGIEISFKKEKIRKQRKEKKVAEVVE